MAKLSTTQCAEMAGVSSRTIQNAIKSGKLSATRDNKGSYSVDLSEFLRVYPEAKHNETGADNGRIGTKEEQLTLDYSGAELEALRVENETLKQQIKTQNERIEELKDQIAKADGREAKLLEAVNATTRLLTYQQDKESTQTKGKGFFSKLFG